VKRQVIFLRQTINFFFFRSFDAAQQEIFLCKYRNFETCANGEKFSIDRSINSIASKYVWKWRNGRREVSAQKAGGNKKIDPVRFFHSFITWSTTQ